MKEISIGDMIISKGHKDQYLRGTEKIGASDIPTCGRKVILDRIIGSDVGDLSQIIVKKKGNVFEGIVDEAIIESGTMFFTQGKVKGKPPLDDFVATLDVVIPLDEYGNTYKGEKVEDQKLFEEMLQSASSVVLVELKTTGTNPEDKKYLKQVCAQRMVLREYIKVEKCKIFVANLNKKTKEFDIDDFILDELEEDVTERIIQRTDALYCHRTGQDYQLPDLEISGLCIKHCSHVDTCPVFTNGNTEGIDKISEQLLEEMKIAIDEKKDAEERVEHLKEEIRGLLKKFKDPKGKYPTLKGEYIKVNASGGKDVKTLPKKLKPRLERYLKKKYPKVSVDTPKLKRSKDYKKLIAKYGVDTETPLRLSFSEVKE